MYYERMTIADDILKELELTRRRHSQGLTADELAALIFGRRNSYPQRVEHPLRQLRDARQIERQGDGWTCRPIPLSDSAAKTSYIGSTTEFNR
jgi:hypothetical protein